MLIYMLVPVLASLTVVLVAINATTGVKLVHGEIKQQTVGLVRASFIMLWHLWKGRVHLLPTWWHYDAHVSSFSTEDGRSFMVFQIEMFTPQEYLDKKKDAKRV
jgi:hypothetical protein